MCESGAGFVMADGIFTVVWQTVTAVPIPGALTGQNLASGTVITNTIAPYLNNPLYAGITVATTGTGGQARLQLCFGPEQVGKRILAYVTFSSTITEFEVQIWGAGCWSINNPGNGPAQPNQITLGTPVGVTDPFPPGESDLPHPPPTHDPFIPWLLVNIDQGVTECALADVITVTINPISTVAIASATVYYNGSPTGVTLSQLLGGVTFDQPGGYEVRIVYQYLGDGTPQNPPGPPGEILTRDFSISEAPFPHMQRQSRIYSWVEPGEAMLFDDALVDDGTVEYDSLTGAFTLRFCGDYFIKWFVVPEGGLTTDGANFAVAVNGSTDLVGASHGKVSPTVGFSIVKVNGPPPTIQLVNVSDGNIELSKMTQVTAGIVIHKIGDEIPGGGA